MPCFPSFIKHLLTIDSCAALASNVTWSSRPTSPAIRTRSWPPTSSSTSLMSLRTVLSKLFDVHQLYDNSPGACARPHIECRAHHSAHATLVRQRSWSEKYLRGIDGRSVCQISGLHHGLAYAVSNLTIPLKAREKLE
jgi:hypothetical protein